MNDTRRFILCTTVPVLLKLLTDTVLLPAILESFRNNDTKTTYLFMLILLLSTLVGIISFFISFKVFKGILCTQEYLKNHELLAAPIITLLEMLFSRGGDLLLPLAALTILGLCFVRARDYKPEIT